jgi:signal transduction histidine kinase
MAERNHTLECDLDSGILIEGDPTLLNRAVANLLDNEVVHLPRGCRIRLVLRAKGEMAQLSLADDGPGFPPEVRGRALERFVKGKHSTGHGLGLAFVNAVVQAHGGKIHISDRSGGGTLIEVTLPMAKVLKTQPQMA